MGGVVPDKLVGLLFALTNCGCCCCCCCGCGCGCAFFSNLFFALTSYEYLYYAGSQVGHINNNNNNNDITDPVRNDFTSVKEREVV